MCLKNPIVAVSHKYYILLLFSRFVLILRLLDTCNKYKLKMATHRRPSSCLVRQYFNSIEPKVQKYKKKNVTQISWLCDRARVQGINSYF